MLLETPNCDYGWQAPDFTLKDAYGETVTMSEYMGENGLLIVFICNHCPYVQAVAERFAEDAKTLQDEGVNVLAVMSNDYETYEEDSPENMRLFAEDKGFTFPYLVDADQEVGKKYGAVCTPDLFGFNNKGELQYRGRVDNIAVNGNEERVPEMLNAMRMVAETGKGPEEQAPSMGCSIKWSE